MHKRTCATSGENKMKQMTFALAAWSAKGKTTRRERFLAEMNAVIPWARLVLYRATDRCTDETNQCGDEPQLDCMLN
jgi:hypothetical protein